jgi:NitT/TauT family transport system ATP-binding protein
MTGSASRCIELQNVSRHFDSGTERVHALDNVSLNIDAGQFVSVVGPSGCGKSTLLMLVAGLQKASSGNVIVNGVPVDRPQTNVGIVFQTPVLMAWRNVLDNVLVQIEMRQGLDKEHYRTRALALLKSVGLEGFERHLPHQLSGGMRQRVAIIRALIHNPPLLLMDEPLGALDELTRDQMLLDLRSICTEGDKTVLFITHSIREAVFLSDRIVVMTPRPGRIDSTVDVDLPRPRGLAVQDTSNFVQYSRRIRERFLAHGVLHDPVVAAQERSGEVVSITAR